ncbi:TPA: thioredoxin [Patescibacteria group bacterium]|nr:thioredoxin [Candidatus Gracilibacteria bacterium]
MNEVQITSVEQFREEVLNFDGISLIDFWAEWCGPCRILTPIIHDIAAKYSQNPKVKIIKINVDENQELAGALQIQSIPTVFLSKEGKIIDKMIGVRQAMEYEQKIESALK